MRCKNCKQKIENENLFRCPKCGKPLTKKKKKDPKELASLIAFITVSGLFVVMNFFSLFFKCGYYNTTALIIGIVVYMVAIPFVFGEWKSAVRYLSAILVSVPLIGNWLAVFVPNSYTLAINGYTSAYYYSVIGVLTVVDVILILKALGTVKNVNVVKWICLGLGVALTVFSLVFYIPSGQVKGFAIAIIAVNCFTSAYIGYYVMSKDGKKSLT